MIFSTLNRGKLSSLPEREIAKKPPKIEPGQSFEGWITRAFQAGKRPLQTEDPTRITQQPALASWRQCKQKARKTAGVLSLAWQVIVGK